MRRHISAGLAVAAVLAVAGAGQAGATERAMKGGRVTDRTLHLVALATGDSEQAFYTDNQRYTTSVRALTVDDPFDRIPRGVTVAIRIRKVEGTDDFCLTVRAPHLKHVWSLDPIRWGGVRRDGRC